MFAEGAFNAAFVPLFAGVVEGQGQAAAHRFAIEVYSVLLSWLVLFTILAMLAMPLIMVVIAPGFVEDKETFDLAVALTRIAFPYLLFMSLTALQSGVLSNLNRFTAAAAAPILLNLALIGSNLVAWRSAPAIRRRPVIFSPGAFLSPGCCSSCCWRWRAGALACRSCRGGRE